MNISEASVEVKVIRVYALCGEVDEEGRACAGRLMADQNAPIRASYPPQYLHRCDVCDHRKLISGKMYPLIRYIDLS